MTNYTKGRGKEYRLMNKLKQEGYKIVFRSAGSHSKIDVVGIKQKEILFIQSKPKSMSKNKRAIIEHNNCWLNGFSKVKFEVR